MSINFGPLRLITFVICVMAFWALDGFVNTVPDADGHPVSLGGAWVRPLLMFFLGAVMVSFVDHYIGNVERQNLRWLYLLVGVGLMVGSYYMIKAAKAAAAVVHTA